MTQQSNQLQKKSRNGCGWECCPSGFVEHVKHYRYLRRVTERPYRITFLGYWWHELKGLIGLNNGKGDGDD